MADIADRPRRRSVFTEILDEDAQNYAAPDPSLFAIKRHSTDLSSETIAEEEDENDWEDYASDDDERRTVSLPQTAVQPAGTTSRLYRVSIFAFMLAIFLSLLHNSPLLRPHQTSLGTRGGVIRHAISEDNLMVEEAELVKRDNTPTSICKRWAHQSALVNGTLYVYGGRRTTDSSQTQNTWVNDFLTMDLTKTWQISNPSLTGLPEPSGVPSVAQGYLWNSHNSLFLYGGEFSDSPVTSPVPFALWEYDIPSSTWKQHNNPQTSAGTNATGDGQPVQRAAEGAGVNIPMLGRGYYFGGHQDYLTTAGWSYYDPRVYLKSMIEFTFPGSTNTEVTTLGGGKVAGTDGNWRNVTEGGLQDTSGFTERADGLLLYVPGFGDQGLLLGLAGGTNATFTQMNVIDVYDIATSTWYKQATSGTTPKYRVNPCAVVAAAADGSSYNVYMFGGQNLVPAGDQIQYDDMWILSIPSFTWIQVDQSKQSVPYARAGHTCHIWDGQMVVVGGYVGQDLSCDSPGIYVFNASSLTWGTQFTSLSGPPTTNNQGAANGGLGDSNPFSQQLAQKGTNSSAGLEGSYGYQVPAAVISVIGGAPTGGATVTAPVQSATSGPLATGKPQTYTVAGPSGSIVTETATPNGGGGANNGYNSHGTNVGAIVGGVLAGVFFLLACYLGFCAWLYRKQLTLYKNHVNMAQRAAADPQRAEKEGFIVPPRSKHGSDKFGGQNGSGNSGSGVGSGAAAGLFPSQGTTPYESSGGRGSGPGGPRRSSESSETEDLLGGAEPSYFGVLLNPRRSLRVINRD